MMIPEIKFDTDGYNFKEIVLYVYDLLETEGYYFKSTFTLLDSTDKASFSHTTEVVQGDKAGDIDNEIILKKEVNISLNKVGKYISKAKYYYSDVFVVLH